MTGGLPLEGLMVADFGRELLIPHTTCYLAWLGAEVIRVESRELPDVTRDRIKLRGLDINSGKLNLSLNLKRPEAVEVAKKLVGISDIVTENYSPGTMAKLGLGYDELKKVKKDIIMVSGSGFGQTGPESKYRSYAGIFASMGGLCHLTGYRDGVPTELRSSVDTMCSNLLAVSVLSALLHRRRTGEGQYIDFAARDAVVSLTGDVVVGYGLNGAVPGPQGNEDDLAGPHDCYPCQGEDEWISIAVFNDEEWQALCKGMDASELAADPRFRDLTGRVANREALDEAVSAWTRKHGAYGIMAKLQPLGVAAVPVMSSAQIFEDPHLKARGFVQETEHPTEGKVLYLGPPWRLADGTPPIKWLGRDIGTSNEYVLKDLLGLNAAEIARLEETGALA
ncbi:MAG: CoA transferase [Chloroflexota bacterium]